MYFLHSFVTLVQQQKRDHKSGSHVTEINSTLHVDEARERARESYGELEAVRQQLRLALSGPAHYSVWLTSSPFHTWRQFGFAQAKNSVISS